MLRTALLSTKQATTGGLSSVKIDPKQSIVFALIAANVAVTIGWLRVESTQWRYREQHLRIFSPSMRTMLAHFTTSTQHLKEARYYTLLTVVFSQATISHLSTNMIGMYFFGSQLCDVLGHRKFLGLYLTSGVLSSAVAVL
ncbi:hypothetical protein PsorP6_002144 [Peronosclerospora sorghi]|uniref:Uncharacterized protein n=1 Tax=Peronosclerospora sorghi TaxID=230839 RepID=A0ACC0WUM9_9STRA|nr:hypothetical protein PsorP6_002144 [Peronosclerospora sorghi]